MIRGVLIACTVCLANAESPMLDAARLGVLVMAGVTCGVLAGFARWFRRLARLSSSTNENP